MKTFLFLLSELIWIKGENDVVFASLKRIVNAWKLAGKTPHYQYSERTDEVVLGKLVLDHRSSAPFEMRPCLREKAFRWRRIMRPRVWKSQKNISKAKALLCKHRCIGFWDSECPPHNVTGRLPVASRRIFLHVHQPAFLNLEDKIHYAAPFFDIDFHGIGSPPLCWVFLAFILSLT